MFFILSLVGFFFFQQVNSSGFCRNTAPNSNRGFSLPSNGGPTISPFACAFWALCERFRHSEPDSQSAPPTSGIRSPPEWELNSQLPDWPQIFWIWISKSGAQETVFLPSNPRGFDATEAGELWPPILNPGSAPSPMAESPGSLSSASSTQQAPFPDRHPAGCHPVCSPRKTRYSYDCVWSSGVISWASHRKFGMSHPRKRWKGPLAWATLWVWLCEPMLLVQ